MDVWVQWSHHSDVIMSAMASQTTGVSIVYSAVCSGVDKKTPKLRVTGLCEGNSAVTGEFPAQRTSNAWITCIWWRHHMNIRDDVIPCEPWMVCPGWRIYAYFVLRIKWSLRIDGAELSSNFQHKLFLGMGGSCPCAKWDKTRTILGKNTTLRSGWAQSYGSMSLLLTAHPRDRLVLITKATNIRVYRWRCLFINVVSLWQICNDYKRSIFIYSENSFNFYQKFIFCLQWNLLWNIISATYVMITIIWGMCAPHTEKLLRRHLQVAVTRK